MIVEITHLYVRPERAQEFAADLPGFKALASSGDDCCGVQLGPVRDKPHYYICEITRPTVADHDAWLASRAAAELERRFGPMLAGTEKIRARILAEGLASRASDYGPQTGKKTQ